jgi:MFS family permease
MPLYALVTRESFGEKIMGSAYGAVFLVSTLGMGLGSFAGGWLYDTFGSYNWLYVSSALIGVAAVALGLTFRTSRTRAVSLPAASPAV